MPGRTHSRRETRFVSGTAMPREKGLTGYGGIL
jgi:hypothetical protein